MRWNYTFIYFPFAVLPGFLCYFLITDIRKEQ